MIMDRDGLPIFDAAAEGEAQSPEWNGDLLQGSGATMGTTLEVVEDGIEAGNVSSVSPGTVTTDDAGLASFDLTYAQEFANWVVVTIEARTSVSGT